MSKTIYELELHENAIIHAGASPNTTEGVLARRVAGGWVYTSTKTFRQGSELVMTESSVFVPYSDEFAPKLETDLPTIEN